MGYSGHEKSGQIISWAAISIGASSLEDILQLIEACMEVINLHHLKKKDAKN